jgi:nicotinamide phosphoribosyltransferase
MNTILPKRRVHKTPRLLLADAYTIGSNLFQSKEAKEKSVYYITYRRELHKINPLLYNKGDNRIVFVGLQRIIDKLFYEPITHQEIDETKRFLKYAKVTTRGFKPYHFPEELWRRVVDEFNGRPPIEILAMPEGSVVYPNEPIIQITSLVDGFGELAAWFESKLLHCWAASERVTQSRHWFEKLKRMVRTIDPNLSETEVSFFASLMLHDFGDRAGIVLEESEEMGMDHLYTFGGTDTFSGAYQAWKNSNEDAIGVFSSVYALAHRNVQAFNIESDCYETLYNKCEDGDIISMVADCYDYKFAVENYLIPLAKRSIDEKNDKIVVARPDSGDPKEQVLWTCNLAVKHGLYTTKIINGVEWKYATSLHLLEGDGMDWETMWDIIEEMLNQKFVPYSWMLFGVGGGQRNGLKRDNLSAKYALCSMGIENIPVVKFSDTIGKTTLPGPFKVLRTPEALSACKTIIFDFEDGINAMVEYFKGTRLEKPFGIGQDDDFIPIKNRIDEQFSTMPLTLTTESNHNYPASDLILQKRYELLEKYSPSRNKNDY